MVCMDPLKLENSIRTLISDEKMQREYYQKAVEVTQAHHSIESSTATFEKVIEEVVRRSVSKEE